MCLEKVWVIPISSKCCRKILSEKWKINPFFQFCSWHFPTFQANKKIGQLAILSSHQTEPGWRWEISGLIWVLPAASAGYDDTWRWRGWARHVDYFSCSRYCVSHSRPGRFSSPEAARTIFSDAARLVAAWPGILAVNTGGQFAGIHLHDQ